MFLKITFKMISKNSGPSFSGCATIYVSLKGNYIKVEVS